jgi:serine/threonine-protein kinase
VFDAGKDGAVTYLVMEFVDGVNLKHCLNNGVRFTPAGAVRLVLSVLAGLEHAHEQRVIHRDVKP